MRYLIAILLVAAAAAAENKTQIYVVDSSATAQAYDVPAKAVCLPGSYGPMCGARGASTAYVRFVRIKARVGNSGMWLTCRIANKKEAKHCGTLLAQASYLAEPKGKDRIIVYAWSNPLYRDDLRKATKLEFTVGARALDPSENTALSKSTVPTSAAPASAIPAK